MDAIATLADSAVDGPWALPEGWCCSKLKEVLPLSYGKSLPKRDRDAVGAIPVFGSSGPVGTHSEALAPARCIIVGRKGSAGAVFFSKRPSWPIDTVYFTSGSEAIDIEYGFRFLEYRKLERLDQSTAIPSLSRDIYNEVDIPLAPLAEQRRIVARIDALFTEIAEGEAALEEARKGLDTFRRALLKAAVTGELTKDWREANPVSETGHDLLERIAATRGGEDSRKGHSRRQRQATPADTTTLPALPEEWAWATLDQVKTSDQRNGISIAGSASPPGVKAMRLDALTPSGIDLNAIRYIPLPEHRVVDYQVNAGDLLISRANGSAEFVGRAVFVDTIAESVVFPDTIIRYPLGDDHEIGRWMELAWNSPLGRRQIRRFAKTTAGILKISQEDISQIVLPVPPPAETAEIIRRVSDALAAQSDTLVMLDAEAADAARLRQSVLKAAFEGRLVPQDPADEPASAVLARLAARPDATPAKRSRAKARA
jgi:type I restriction enzyme S subunit